MVELPETLVRLLQSPALSFQQLDKLDANSQNLLWAYRGGVMRSFVYVINRLYFWNTPSTLALKTRLNRNRGSQVIHYSLNEKQLHLVTRGDIWNTIHEWNTNQKQKEELQKREEFLWRSLLSRYGVSLRSRRFLP